MEPHIAPAKVIDKHMEHILGSTSWQGGAEVEAGGKEQEEGSGRGGGPHPEEKALLCCTDVLRLGVQQYEPSF